MDLFDALQAPKSHGKIPSGKACRNDTWLAVRGNEMRAPHQYVQTNVFEVKVTFYQISPETRVSCPHAIQRKIMNNYTELTDKTIYLTQNAMYVKTEQKCGKVYITWVFKCVVWCWKYVKGVFSRMYHVSILRARCPKNQSQVPRSRANENLESLEFGPKRGFPNINKAPDAFSSHLPT